MTIEQDINLGFFHVAMDRAETAEARVRTLEATIFSISEANDMLLDRAERAEAERDALRRALVEQQRIDAQICRTAQDWSDGSLGWNRACERMALAIEKQTARAALEGK